MAYSTLKWLQGSAACHELDDEDDQGNDQEQMNQVAHNAESETKRPKN
jgi:hypothetical protein